MWYYTTVHVCYTLGLLVLNILNIDDNHYCWPLPSNQSFYRQITGYQRGVHVGGHRVGQGWKGVMGQQNSCKTSIEVHLIMHSNNKEALSCKSLGTLSISYLNLSTIELAGWCTACSHDVIVWSQASMTWLKRPQERALHSCGVPPPHFQLICWSHDWWTAKAVKPRTKIVKKVALV